MEWTFSWNLVSIVTQAMPLSGVFVSDLSATKTRSHLLKLPSAVPLDLLIFEFLVLSCIFSVLLSAGIARSPTASVGRLFSPHCPEYFVEDRKRSLSFSCAGRLAVTRVSDASFSSYHDVTHPAVQVVCSTQNRMTRQTKQTAQTNRTDRQRTRHNRQKAFRKKNNF